MMLKFLEMIRKRHEFPISTNKHTDFMDLKHAVDWNQPNLNEKSQSNLNRA